MTDEPTLTTTQLVAALSAERTLENVQKLTACGPAPWMPCSPVS
jgi:hypothetical protein